MKTILGIIFKIRAFIMRSVTPVSENGIFTPSYSPISTKFGFDRGTPIDRYFIDAFLTKNSLHVRGICLEIGDDRYTKQYGEGVVKTDILDVDASNKKATIIGNLKDLHGIIADNTYDCIVLTHVLGMIDDVSCAVGECYRILKPGGMLLATMSSLSPIHKNQSNCWRFTPQGALFVFSGFFNKQSVSIESYGNAYTGQCFWLGLSQEEIDRRELSKHDPEYPNIVAVAAKK